MIFPYNYRSGKNIDTGIYEVFTNNNNLNIRL